MSEDYLKDIQDIKQIMEERTRFLSLSGMSGILSGFYALIGAVIAYYWAGNSSSVAYQDLENLFLSPIVLKFLMLALIILIMSLATAFYFTRKKAISRSEALWSKASVKALKSFAIPLLTGGVFIGFLLYRGELDLIAASSLIFYGIALFSAGHYTLRDVQILGIVEIIVGLISMLFTGYGLYFWALGFGVLHVIYGTIMYYKYDRD